MATLERLFLPLGYQIDATALPLDDTFPEWGDSQYFRLKLKAEVTLHDLLSHLYVLLPVLDEEKHYYIGSAEVEKLLRHGEGWLAQHPDKDFIVRRYLFDRTALTLEAFEQRLGFLQCCKVVAFCPDRSYVHFILLKFLRRRFGHIVGMRSRIWPAILHLEILQSSTKRVSSPAVAPFAISAARINFQVVVSPFSPYLFSFAYPSRGY